MKRLLLAVACLAPVALAVASLIFGLTSSRNPFGGFVLVGCATIVGLINQWTSYGRALLHRAREGDLSTYRHVSGMPAIGTILTFAATSLFFGAEWTAAVGLFALAIDTGGSPWFLRAMWNDESLRTGGGDHSLHSLDEARRAATLDPARNPGDRPDGG